MSATTTGQYHRMQKLGAPHAQNSVYHHWNEANDPSQTHHGEISTTLDQSTGSDCGSSSGLGGMKDGGEGESLLGGAEDATASSPDEGGEASDDHDEQSSSTYDRSQNENDTHRTSSKQSAASSGKGSSTGASPTGCNSKSGGGGVNGSNVSFKRRNHSHQLHQRHARSAKPAVGASSAEDYTSIIPCTSAGLGLSSSVHQHAGNTSVINHMNLVSSGAASVASAPPCAPLSQHQLHQQADADSLTGASNISLCGSHSQNSDFSIPPPFVYHHPQHTLMSAVDGGGKPGVASGVKPTIPPNPLNMTSASAATNCTGSSQFHPQMIAPASCSLLVTGPLPNNGSPVYTMTMGPYGPQPVTGQPPPSQCGQNRPAQFPQRSNGNSPYGACGVPPPSNMPSGGHNYAPTRTPSNASAATLPSSAPVQDAVMKHKSAGSGAGGADRTSPSSTGVGAGQLTSTPGPQQHNGLSVSTNNRQTPAGASSSGQHSLYVHVQIGETLTVKFGDEIQHITGPATVRMVSHSEMPPNALPLHVPVGHRIDQILDEGGFLKHVILSPETSCPPSDGQFSVPQTLSAIPTGPPTVPPPTVEHNTPVPPRYTSTPPAHDPRGAASTPGGPCYATQQQQQQAYYQTQMPAQHHQQPPPGSYAQHREPSTDENTGLQRGFGRVTVSTTGRWAEDPKLRQMKHEVAPQVSPLLAVSSVGRPTSLSSSMTLTMPQQQQQQSLMNGNASGARTGPGGRRQGAASPSEHHQHATTNAGGGENGREDSRSGASATEDEDVDRMNEMLNRIQAPQVCEIGARDCAIRWQALDTSEASASGGPFPNIDPSEFTYEVALYEGDPTPPDLGKFCRKQTCVPRPGEPTPQLKLTDLKPDSAYFVRLRARLVERCLDGDPSTPIGFRTKPSHPDKPSPPRLMKRGKNWIIVGWRRPCDNGAHITAYHLYCDVAREGNEATFTEIYTGVGLQKKVQGLETNTMYRLRLTARNQFGTSEPSDTLLMQTSGAAPAPPAPPQLLVAKHTALQLAWTKRAGDDLFTLQMEDPTNGYGFRSCIGSTVETVANIDSLARNREYRFRLLSANDDGQSQPSETVVYRTAAGKPAAPLKPYLKDRVKATSVCLAWEPPKDTGGAEITLYQLDYSVAHGNTTDHAHEHQWRVAYSGAERLYNVTGLQPGCAYQFRLCCVGPAGHSPFSDALTVTTTHVTPAHCPPPELAQKARSNALHVKWGVPSSDGGAEIVEYEVSVDLTSSSSPKTSGGPTVYTKATKTECQISSLQPGRRYVARVRAVNAAGAGHWSEGLEATTAAAPPAPPTQLRVMEGDALEGAVQLTWNAPHDTNGAPVTEYRLRAAKGIEEDVSDVAWTQVYSGSACKATIKDLAPATDYMFQIQAVNQAGAGAFAAPPLTHRSGAAVPDAPAGVEVEPQGTDQLEVVWDGAADNGSPLLTYLVDVKPTTSVDSAAHATDPFELQADKTRLTVADLHAETQYSVRVAAVNALGRGSWSSYVKATTFSNPPEPPSLEVQSYAHNALRLRWQDAKTAPFDETYTYGLEVENKAGSFSPVYEGMNRNHRAQRLQENTVYRFRIRATSPTGGVGAWSDPVAFRTPRAPPPALKSEPKITQVNGDSWQVEWSPVKMTGGDRLVYAVQTSAIGASPVRQHNAGGSDEWKTVYRGGAQSYVLSNLPTGTHRVRVVPIRVSLDRPPTAQHDMANDDDKPTKTGATPTPVETSGPPSKHAIISNQIELARDEKRSSVDAASTNGSVLGEPEEDGVAERWGEAHIGAALLIGFSLIAIFFAYGVMKLIEE